jgi:hypothetical protein
MATKKARRSSKQLKGAKKLEATKSLEVLFPPTPCQKV